MTDVPDDERGHCWGCGYLLRGVESANCPECGRAFDRSDRASMNFGRPMGRVARFLVRPVGWPVVCVAIVGAACVLATTRWPVAGWDASPQDVAYYADAAAWAGRAPMTGTDAAYMAGLLASGLALAWWVLRAVFRADVILRYRVPRWQRRSAWRRSVPLLLLSACAAAGVLAGWPYRLGQRWVAEARAERPGVTLLPFKSPVALTPEARRAVLRAALRQGWGPKDRLWAVKVCSEGGPEVALIADSIAAERDASTRAWKVRVCGLHRDEALGPMFVGLLEDPEPTVRAAAADALGELHHSVSNSNMRDGDLFYSQGADETTDSDPPVRRPELIDGSRATPAGAREALLRRMTAGATTEEREAAARALVHWPPDRYRFRLAEWGVFRVDPSGGTQFMDAQLAEVPPFVHRTGDAAASLLGRLKEGGYFINVMKPVLHLTVDAPLAVSIKVLIARGRPLVAYPKPDDFFLASKVTQQEFVSVMSSELRMPRLPTPVQAPTARALPNLAVLDNPRAAAFDDPREGYPWLIPRHQSVSFYHLPTTDAQLANRLVPSLEDLKGIGLHWQSLIVAPTRLPWMTDAAVGPEPRFAWWERLRKVECSYVSSRGECERFMYYDGPSLGPARVWAGWAAGGDALEWGESGDVVPAPDGGAAAPGAPAPRRPRASIYVECEGGGGGGAIDVLPYVRVGAGTQRLALSGVGRISINAAERWLERALLGHGLSTGEAAGLLDCWREAFFRTPGRRFLSVVSGADYDALCPIAVRPPPTETARVAIFWTELGQPKAAAGR